MNIRYAPQFVTPHIPQLSGVDYLGIRQVNFDLMDQCIPGINNAARYVRCFSVMSWAFWKMYKLSASEKMSERDMELFREKIEILFTMGHQNRQLSLPGGEMKPANASDNSYPLSFDYWSRINSSTGLTSAVQYGPPLSSSSGLGFTTIDYDSGIKLATEQGEDLAQALEKNLVHSSRYELIDDLSQQRASYEDADRLMDYWSVSEVTSEEASVFRGMLCPEDSETKKSINRVNTIHYIQSILFNQSIPADINELRSAMFLGRTIEGKEVLLSAANEITRQKWIVLQIRQLQRLALEALFSLVEQYMDAISTDINGMIEEFMSSAGLEESVRAIDYFTKLGYGEDIYSLINSAGMDDSVNPVIFAADFESAINAGDLGKIATCIWEAFALSYAYSSAVQTSWDSDEVTWMLSHGGDRQHSLGSYLAFMNDHPTITVREFVGHMMGLVITMHLYITAVRFEPGKMKSRLFVDGKRIDRIATGFFKPYRTQDRLQALAGLMIQSELIS